VSRNQRSQHMNKRAAFVAMTKTAKFRIWLNKKIWLEGRDPEAEVRRMMQPHNLLVEGRRDGEWQIIG
jgi:hypothetical protein